MADPQHMHDPRTQSPDGDHATAPRTPDTSADVDSAPVSAAADRPRRIGEYVIRRVIASGGMGVVYEALQDHPNRSVALKLMKQGLSSRTAMRRFEFESQVLGRLRHPCIAQVYDAGVHDDGSGAVPYFVMEYVPAAQTLTQHAMTHKLGTRDRLALFAQVCDGVHHGHQKGVIHRDLKPANILVDASGQAKIIDFGVARATDADLAVTTLHTDIGQLVGTLQYMSPEQIEGDPNDLDVRSDVYALGVILYELLTGRLPYTVMNRTVVDASRMIREQEPQRLSTIDHDLRGDVETIAFKALQKDREARYQSASDLAQDIRRYLSNEPISARPPSVLYQVRVFARRNKAAFAAIVAIVAVSLAAAVVSTVFARRASVARDRMEAAMLRARQEAEANKAAGDFMRDVLALASPQRALGRQITIREALDIAAANITAATADQPLAEASARIAVGSTYRALGLYPEAHEHLTRAIEIRTRLRGADDPETLTTITELAGVLGDLNRGPEAIALLNDNLARQRLVLGPLSVDTLRTANALAWLKFGSGDYADAERLFRQSHDGFQQVLGHDSALTLKAKTNIAMSLASQDRIDIAEPLARDAASAAERLLGARNPDTLYARHTLAWTLLSGDRLAEAEAIWRRVVDDATDVMGQDHPYRLFWLNSLCWCLLDQGKLAEAEPLFAEVVSRRMQVLAEGHPDTFNSLLGHATVLERLGRVGAARELAQRARQQALERYGESSRIAEGFDALLARVLTASTSPSSTP